jgi:hypothetical protein
MTDDRRSHSSRSHYAYRGAFPKACGPFPALSLNTIGYNSHTDLPSPDATYPILKAIQVSDRSRHVRIANIDRAPLLPGGTFSAHVVCRCSPMHPRFARSFPTRHWHL